MRHIGELADEAQADVFAAFLLVKRIESQVEPQSDGGAEVWIKDEDQFDEAVGELELFKSDPTHSRYSDSIQDARTIVRDEEKRLKRIRKKIVHVGAGKLKRRPPLTLTLIGLCVLVALMTDFGDLRRSGPDHPIYRALQFVSVGPPESLTLNVMNPDDLRRRLASIRRGEVWRLVTTMFIHYGVWHLVFNMYWLFLFGSMIENRYGALKLGVLILLTAAISNVVQCAVPVDVGGSAPVFIRDSQVMISILGGMSGVVYGLFGFVWMKTIYDPKTSFRLAQSTVVLLIGWLVLCMIPDLVPDLDPNSLIFRIVGANVANWAHGIGLMVGAIAGYATTMLMRR